jgi:hypothetical protein
MGIDPASLAVQGDEAEQPQVKGRNRTDKNLVQNTREEYVSRADIYLCI